MRILSWVQNKINGNQEKKRFDVGSCSSHRSFPSIPDERKEEFSDWPQSFLAIGTLGNTDIKEDTERQNPSDILKSSEELDFSLEEVIKLKKELTKLLWRKSTSMSKTSVDGSETGERANRPLNRFLNCPSSLEVARRNFDNLGGSGENYGDLSPDSKIILNKARDILADKRNAIRQKSFSYLLKKMFVCSNGFAPAPSRRDPFSETKMEKIMKILLHKKIHHQSSTAMLAKKYLETKSMGKLEYKETRKEKEKEEDGYKWVKTDSDFIVLEM